MFHVSPFCEVKGHYRFRFEQVAGRAFAQIDYYDSADSIADESGKLIVTTLQGASEALTSGSALRAFLSHPLMTLRRCRPHPFARAQVVVKTRSIFHQTRSPLARNDSVIDPYEYDSK